MLCNYLRQAGEQSRLYDKMSVEKCNELSFLFRKVKDERP
jgi:hypothetical protein